MRTVARRLLVAAYIGCVVWPISAAEDPIDVQKSRLTVFVYKAGLFSAFGDNHTIAAPISTGAISEGPLLSVRMVINAGDLRVIDDSLDATARAEVQRRMLGTDVLDTARFPTITFS